MDIESSSYGDDGLVEIANAMKDVSQAKVAHVGRRVWGIVYGTAKTLNGIGRITFDSPVERSNVEEDPVWAILLWRMCACVYIHYIYIYLYRQSYMCMHRVYSYLQCTCTCT